MGLFSRLLNFQTGSIPLEDFFTEIVAFWFESNPNFLHAWLQHVHALDEKDIYSHVDTQKSFPALEHHTKDSRPDMVIELVGDTCQDIVFLESKIGSSEGGNQLQRYAEILANLSGYRHKTLIYITRDFEPKDKSVIFQDVSQHQIKFKQLRWYQFYQFLSLYKETTLTREICSFMEENEMGHSSQFSDTDIQALANFPQALKLMDVTMRGKVTQRFEEVTGQKQTRNNALKQLLDYGNYNIVAGMPTGKWFCCLGFLLQSTHIAAPLTVALWLGAEPKSAHKFEIVAMMQAVCSQRGWRGTELTTSLQAKPRIFREQSLQTFLSEEDQISAIQDFFMKALAELQEIQKQYKHLPWSAY
ncbi:PD-(D/E)XK nuclease family protein [Leptothoe spongobia]|nr:PD-(D/E)XK nuclease family protein [Leptothoe spongobia]